MRKSKIKYCHKTKYCRENLMTKKKMDEKSKIKYCQITKYCHENLMVKKKMDEKE